MLESHWEDQANCADVTPSLMYPDRGAAPSDVDAAKAVCAGCSVRSVCLETALARSERFGIWGGTTETERRAIRRERRLAVAS